MKIKDFITNIYEIYNCRFKVAIAYVNVIEKTRINYKNESKAFGSLGEHTLYRLLSFGSKDTSIINIMGHENNDYNPFAKKEDFKNLETDIYTMFIPMERYNNYTYLQKIKCIGELYETIFHEAIKK